MRGIEKFEGEIEYCISTHLDTGVGMLDVNAVSFVCFLSTWEVFRYYVHGVGCNSVLCSEVPFTVIYLLDDALRWQMKMTTMMMTLSSPLLARR